MQNKLSNKNKFILYVVILVIIVAAITAMTTLAFTNVKVDKLIVSYETQLTTLEESNNELYLNYTNAVADNLYLAEANKGLSAAVVDLENRLVEAADIVKDFSTYKIYARDIIALCKVTNGEACTSSDMQKAAVVWCVLNRVDKTGDSIYKTIIMENQFHGYNPNLAVRAEELSIVIDVLFRWQREKLTGEMDSGRVLPKEFTFFAAGGFDENGQLINVFRDRDDFNTAVYWDFSCEDPYK